MIWILLVVFQFKHFLADYILQGTYMLGKFKDKGWVLPLAAHCGVHLLFTTVIAFSVFVHAALTTVTADFQSTNLYIALLMIAGIFGLVDFIIHFVMDRIKASPKLLGRFQALSKKEMIASIDYEREVNERKYTDTFKAKMMEHVNKERKSNVLFWWSLGFDQMVHHLTDILLIALIMSMI